MMRRHLRQRMAATFRALMLARLTRPALRGVIAVILTLPTMPAAAQQTATSEPQLNQPGKDVQWVPPPPQLVEKMLDLAQVTKADRFVDLGSGDGVLVIAAAA